MMTTLDLSGLDGSNPLGFLAALGTVRAASGALGRDVTMQWMQEAHWFPRIQVEVGVDREEFLGAIHGWLSARVADFAVDNPSSGEPYKNLNIPRSVFRGTIASANGPERLEALAALGTDATTEEQIRDTAFRTQSGAGHQHYLDSIAKLGELTTKNDLERALFSAWTYEDDSPYLRLDPNDDRRYALRWQNPSKQTKGFEIRTVRGANRLAVEGLRLYPVIPARRAVETTGFERRNRETLWSWPIWNRAADLETVRSMLASSQMQAIGSKDEHDHGRSVLIAIGIVQVFRSRRMTINKMRNFSPASAV